MTTASEPSGRGRRSFRRIGRIGGSQLFVATFTTHRSTSARRSPGSPRTSPLSPTPRKRTPPSALANATSSPAMSSVCGERTPRSPSTTSLNSARPSSPAANCLRISSSVLIMFALPFRYPHCSRRRRKASALPYHDLAGRFLRGKSLASPSNAGCWPRTLTRAASSSAASGRSTIRRD